MRACLVARESVVVRSWRDSVEAGDDAMRVRVHADDFGVSRGVSDGILQCIDEGPVESISIIANGAAFDYAVAALRARPRVAISVHLNLIEGPSVTHPREVDLLVDTGGLLRNSFRSLWRTHAFGTAAIRTRLEAQVRAELYAQARKVRDAMGATCRCASTATSTCTISRLYSTSLPICARTCPRSACG